MFCFIPLYLGFFKNFSEGSSQMAADKPGKVYQLHLPRLRLRCH